MDRPLFKAALQKKEVANIPHEQMSQEAASVEKTSKNQEEKVNEGIGNEQEDKEVVNLQYKNIEGKTKKSAKNITGAGLNKQSKSKAVKVRNVDQELFDNDDKEEYVDLQFSADEDNPSPSKSKSSSKKINPKKKVKIDSKMDARHVARESIKLKYPGCINLGKRTKNYSRCVMSSQTWFEPSHLQRSMSVQCPELRLEEPK